MRNIVVIGRGAVGAIYAKALSRCDGVRLRVAVDRQRLERYRNEPFLINGEPITFDYFTPSLPESVDLIIIATKWSGYCDAMAMSELLAGEQTQIVPLLNGLLAYEQAVARFGAARVLRAYFFGHTASRSDSGVTQDGSYRTVFGEDINVEGRPSPRVAAIAALWDRAGIKYRIDPDMISSQWQKFVINIGTNQVTALDGGLNYGEMLTDEARMVLSVDLMREAVAVAAAQGVANTHNMIAKALDAFGVMQGSDYSSMAQDVIAHRPTEVDIFAGHVVRLAQKHNISAPENLRILNMIGNK